MKLTTSRQLSLSVSLTLLTFGLAANLTGTNNFIRNSGAALAWFAFGGAALSEITRKLNLTEANEVEAQLQQRLKAAKSQLEALQSQPPQVVTQLVDRPVEVIKEVEKPVKQVIYQADPAITEALQQALQQAEHMSKANHKLEQANYTLKQDLQARQLTQAELVSAFTNRMQANLEQLVNQSLASLLEAIQNKAAILLAKDESDVIGRALNKLADDVEEKLDIYRELISKLTPDFDNPLNDLDEFSGIYTQISNEVSSLKTRFRNSLNVKERLALKDSVTRQYAVNQLQALAKEQDNFNLTVEECQQQIEDLLATVEAHRATIDTLNNELNQARVNKPVKWPIEVRDDHRMGNLIIEYFHIKGIWLDRAYAKFDGHSSKVAFNPDRHHTAVLLKTLNDEAEALQHYLGCLNKPEFKRQDDTGLIETVLVISEKPKVKRSRDEIDKLWEAASKFPHLVSKWSRIRITGGSEAGKTPTAENVAVCILNHKQGPKSIRFYNPQYNSQKNFQTMPVVGFSHPDSASGVLELAQRSTNRSQGLEPRDEFVMYVFDEFDSTLTADKKKASELSSAMKDIVKQVSHQNLGAIFLGQNANVKQFQGQVDRSDMNNLVAIHIGANAKDAIENSNRSQEEKKSLLATAEKLTQFCQQQNEDLGLESSNPKAYRFALVLDPKRPPYFMELPEFGLYPYLEAPQPVSQPTQALASPQAPTEALGPASCPHCQHDRVRVHNRKQNRFKCLNELCGKTFTHKPATVSQVN